MARNTLGKQWGNIMAQFERAEQVQRQHNTETIDAGCEVDDYNAGRLRVLELGVAFAKDYYREFRFKFWLKPILSENQITVDFLLGLKEYVETWESGDAAYKAGMMVALDNWISQIVMEDAEAREVLSKLRIPGAAK